MYHKLLNGAISSRAKEAVGRLSHHLSSKTLAAPFLRTRSVFVRPKHEPIVRNKFPLTKSAFKMDFITNSRGFSTYSSVDQARESWLAWFEKKKKVIALVVIYGLAFRYYNMLLGLALVFFPGDHVHYERVREVYPEEIGSERIQKVIDDLVKVMRKQDIISLSAPQIGVPLQIIVLDKFPIAHPPEEDYESQDNRPVDLQVIVNPKIKDKSRNERLRWESCVGVPGFVATVKRILEVEVTGLNRDGQPIKMDAPGWHARVLQHECDHLHGFVYVVTSKAAKQKFKTEENCG